MMTFYLNDCIPKNKPEAVLVTALDKTVREFMFLQKKNAGQIDGVVIEGLPHERVLNDENCTLRNCIEKLNKEIRTNAFRIFAKYPIRNYFPEGEDMEILENEYICEIDGISHVAINPAITFLNGGGLFTINIHQDLAKDYLPLKSNDGLTHEVLNLYGLEKNTDFVSTYITQSVAKAAGNLQILTTLINGLLSGKATKQFKQLVPELQSVVISHFEAAIKMSGGINIVQDKELVKEVEVTNCNTPVMELRIFDPVAYRVYFACKSGNICIAAIERKPAKKVQSAHIKAAKTSIETLFAENGLK